MISRATSVRQWTIRIHRWLSLAAALFWLVQAVTGTLIVFHWELDDLATGGVHRGTDLVAIDRRLRTFAPTGAGRSIRSVWTTAGLPDRYDVTVAGPAGEVVYRIDGVGGILRSIEPGERSLSDTIVTLHQTLLLGDLGSWIVGISGLLLLSNLVLGLIAAWPRRGTWRRALRLPSKSAPGPARLYGWHRALGLWMVVPALLLVGAGTALVFKDGVARLVGAPSSPEQIHAQTESTRSFAEIAAAALARHAGASLTAVTFPDATHPDWTVKVRQVGELRRAYGTTTLTLDGSGRILAEEDALSAPAARGFIDALFPLHTGEAGGLAGRIAVLGIGLWLTTMLVLGVLLWWTRRARKQT